jgi:hypothetical protein
MGKSKKALREYRLFYEELPDKRFTKRVKRARK